MRRRLLSLAIATIVLAACSESPATESDPMNAVAELGDSNVDLGYDRTESDPEALARLFDVAGKVAGTEVGCVNPVEVEVSHVKSNHEPVRLPVPVASVECTSIDDENFLFEAFGNEEAKLVFIEAKRELLCERGKLAGTDPGSGLSSFDGLPYVNGGSGVDGGSWILEPDTAGHRDRVAAALDVSGFNMCTNIDPQIDPAPSPEL